MLSSVRGLDDEKVLAEPSGSISEQLSIPIPLLPLKGKHLVGIVVYPAISVGLWHGTFSSTQNRSASTPRTAREGGSISDDAADGGDLERDERAAFGDLRKDIAAIPHLVNVGEGGPSQIGQALALRLRKAGRATLHERRRPTIRVLGVGLDRFQNAVRQQLGLGGRTIDILRRPHAGLMDRVAAHHATDSFVEIRVTILIAQRGQILARFDEQGQGHPFPTVARQIAFFQQDRGDPRHEQHVLFVERERLALKR